MHDKNYTKIPLNELEQWRGVANQTCRVMGNLNNAEYRSKVFWLGPRPPASRTGFMTHMSSRPASTRKADAVAAKLAIYKIQGYYNDKDWRTGKSRRRPYMVLQGYI